MPRKIIIIRHAETDYNAERRLQGWIDIPLNENGLNQAEKIATRLASETINCIYSSDHQRAYQTAMSLAEPRTFKVARRQALREAMMGLFEGWQWEKEVDAARQALWEKRKQASAVGDIHWDEHGGESIAVHTRRVKRFINYLHSQHHDQVVTVVTHGGTINRILEIFGLKQITDPYVGYKNTAITTLIKNNVRYELELHNDISHL